MILKTEIKSLTADFMNSCFKPSWSVDLKMISVLVKISQTLSFNIFCLHPDSITRTIALNSRKQMKQYILLQKGASLLSPVLLIIFTSRLLIRVSAVNLNQEKSASCSRDRSEALHPGCSHPPTHPPIHDWRSFLIIKRRETPTPFDMEKKRLSDSQRVKLAVFSADTFVWALGGIPEDAFKLPWL